MCENRKCKFCKSLIPKKSKICPICNQRIAIPKIKIVISIIFIFAFVNISIYFVDDAEARNKSKIEKQEIEKRELTKVNSIYDYYFSNYTLPLRLNQKVDHKKVITYITNTYNITENEFIELQASSNNLYSNFVKNKVMEKKYKLNNLAVGGLFDLETILKSGLKDPKSYEKIDSEWFYIKDIFIDEYIFLKITYRAKNSFGGYVVGTISANCYTNGTLWNIRSE